MYFYCLCPEEFSAKGFVWLDEWISSWFLSIGPTNFSLEKYRKIYLPIVFIKAKLFIIAFSCILASIFAQQIWWLKTSTVEFSQIWALALWEELSLNGLPLLHVVRAWLSHAHSQSAGQLQPCWGLMASLTFRGISGDCCKGRNVQVSLFCTALYIFPLLPNICVSRRETV